MIKYDGGPACILESLYLGIPLTSCLTEVTIEVNPSGLKWLSGKTIVINDPGYHLGESRGYGNTIISRLPGYPGALYVPYIPRALPKVLWNGQTVGSRADAIDSYLWDTEKLYFPRIAGYGVDPGEDLDWLGYLQFQLGYNHYPGPVRDLDLLKCRGGLRE